MLATTPSCGAHSAITYPVKTAVLRYLAEARYVARMEVLCVLNAPATIPRAVLDVHALK
jgi:hypothetical protein